MRGLLGRRATKSNGLATRRRRIWPRPTRIKPLFVAHRSSFSVAGGLGRPAYGACFLAVPFSLSGPRHHTTALSAARMNIPCAGILILAKWLATISRCYAHLNGLGCFMCSDASAFATDPGMHPS
jgi:hypothetical protein